MNICFHCGKQHGKLTKGCATAVTHIPCAICGVVTATMGSRHYQLSQSDIVAINRKELAGLNLYNDQLRGQIEKLCHFIEAGKQWPVGCEVVRTAKEVADL